MLGSNARLVSVLLTYLNNTIKWKIIITFNDGKQTHLKSNWLNFPQLVTSNLCLLTYKCLHGLAPEYLSRSCVPLTAVHGRSQLRSADDQQLVLPRTSTVTLGPPAFCSSGPASWNSLAVHLRHPDLTIGAVRRQLKTVLFVWVRSLCRITVLV